MSLTVARKLKGFVESLGVRKTCQLLSDSVREKSLRHDQISLRALAEAFMGTGQENLLKLDPARRPFLEASEAVDASAFGAIGGNILIDRIRDKWVQATSLADQLCTTVPITNGNLSTQREPWLSDVAEAPDIVDQGMEYPKSHFEPHYTDLPAPVKRGRICQITMEMIFADRTKQAYDSADSVGRRLGLDKRKRILKVIYGITNPYSWNGTTYNTYQTASPWINKVSGVQVRDWDQINTIEQLFAVMTDPTTGEVIEVEPTAILGVPANKYNLRRAFRATETRTGGYATTDPARQIVAPNPLDVDYPILIDKVANKVLLDSGLTQTQAKDVVILADFKRAFGYREALPLQTFQAPPLSQAEFQQDIVVAVKAREYGVAVVLDPRYAAYSYNN